MSALMLILKDSGLHSKLSRQVDMGLCIKSTARLGRLIGLIRLIRIND